MATLLEPGRTWRTVRLLIVGFLIGVAARSPILQISIVNEELQADGLSTVAIGLLTTLPVIGFAVFAPIGSLATRWAGPARTIGLCLILETLGIVVRSLGGTAPLFVGTVMLGLAVAIVNIAVPVWIFQRFARRSRGMAMGVNLAGQSLGSAALIAITAAAASDHGWAAGLLLGVTGPVLAAVALVTIGRTPGIVSEDPLTPRPGEARVPLRVGPVIILAAAFALQCFTFYAMSSWWPAIIGRVDGLTSTDASLAGALFQLVGFVGCLLAPVLISMTGPTRSALVIVGAWWIFALGMLVYVDGWLVWTVLGGVAQAAAGTMMFNLALLHAENEREARIFATVMQASGYTVGATGPLVVGALLGVSGAWQAPLVLVLGTTSALLVLVLISARSLVRRTQFLAEGDIVRPEDL